MIICLNVEFSSKKDIDKEKYDVFVSYYEDAADDYANRVYKVLTGKGYTVFVAHIKRTSIAGEEFRPFIDRVISKCEIFLLINSVGTLSRPEVIREFKQAYPNRKRENHKLWVFREARENVPRGTEEFTKNTGIELDGINQPSFSTPAELVRKVIEICDNEKQAARIEAPKIQISAGNLSHIKISLKPTALFNYEQLLENANVELRNKNLENAKSYLDRILDFDPLNVGALNNKGIILGMQQNYEEALYCFLSALTITKTVPALWGNKALALQFLGKNEDALQEIGKALGLAPKDKNFLLTKGLILFNLGRFTESIKCYDHILSSTPSVSIAQSGKAAVLGRLGDRTKARQLLDEAIKNDPKNGNAWYNLAVMLFEDKKYEDSLDAYEKTLAIDSKIQAAWLNKGIVLRLLGRYDEAIQDYEEAIKLRPQDPRPYNNIGIALSNMEKYKESIKYYDLAITKDRNFYSAYVNKAISLYRMKKIEDSLSILYDVLRLKEDLIIAFHTIGRILYEESRYQEAEEQMSKALKIFQKDPLIMEVLALSFYWQRKWKETLDIQNRLVEIKPEDVITLINRSTTFIKLGRYEEALMDCESVLKQDGNNAPAYYNKACVMALTTKTNDAMDLLRKAISLDKTKKEEAIKDSDFDKIRNEPEFKKLIE